MVWRSMYAKCSMKCLKRLKFMQSVLWKCQTDLVISINQYSKHTCMLHASDLMHVVGLPQHVKSFYHF